MHFAWRPPVAQLRRAEWKIDASLGKEQIPAAAQRRNEKSALTLLDKYFPLGQFEGSGNAHCPAVPRAEHARASWLADGFHGPRFPQCDYNMLSRGLAGLMAEWGRCTTTVLARGLSWRERRARKVARKDSESAPVAEAKRAKMPLVQSENILRTVALGEDHDRRVRKADAQI